MPYTCTLPDLDTMVVFEDGKGSELCSVDAAELETIITQARIDDKNFDAKDPLSLNAWMGRVAKALTTRIGKPISIGVASLIIRNVNTIMTELKKTLQFEPRWTSPPATESMDSNTSAESRPGQDSDYSQTTSPANEPFENLKSVMQLPG